MSEGAAGLLIPFPVIEGSLVDLAIGLSIRSAAAPGFALQLSPSQSSMSSRHDHFAAPWMILWPYGENRSDLVLILVALTIFKDDEGLFRARICI